MIPPRRFPILSILLLIALVVVLSIGLVLASYRLLSSQEQTFRPGRHFPEAELGAPHTVSLIHQDLFTAGPPEWLVRQQAQLKSYGWVDRKRGLVRIPIAQAIELLAHGAAP